MKDNVVEKEAIPFCLLWQGWLNHSIGAWVEGVAYATPPSLSSCAKLR